MEQARAWRDSPEDQEIVPIRLASRDNAEAMFPAGLDVDSVPPSRLRAMARIGPEFSRQGDAR